MITDQKRKVTVYVSGGCVQNIDAPDGVEVEVWDYDTDGTDEREEIDDDGERFVRLTF